MSYFLVGLITAFFGIIPFLLRKQFISSAVSGTIYTVIATTVVWLTVPATMWPLATPVSIIAFLFWVVSSVVAYHNARGGRYDDEKPKATIFTWAVGSLYALSLMVTIISSSSAFHAQSYASMIGPVKTQNWTSIVQPKSPEHIRMMGDETALYIARKAVSNAGAIGSQFSIDETHMTLQRVNNELVYVVPLDFAGFSVWTSAKGGVPAYIVIDAQDPEAPAKLVKLPENAGMRFTPGAWFGDYLNRYMREHGFLNDGIAEINFELDDSGNIWWVVPTFYPSIGWDAWKIKDVAVVNPVTGEIKRYSLDKVPAWIDRVYPASFIENYLTWYGAYSGGWWNSFWGKASLTKPENPHLIYSSDNRAEWVTGITSASSKDDSLISIAYTDSRSGKTTVYNVDGGATDSAIVNAVNANGDINYRKWHGVAVQMYNIYGSMAAVVPLLNDSGAFQAVAIASVKNPQDVVMGRDQVEALRNYQASLFRKGQQVALSNTADVMHVKGVVDRIAQDGNGTASPYLFHVAGVPRIFVASSRDNIKVPLTRAGDTVVVDYIASGEGQVPVKKFDNLSFLLDETPEQAQLTASGEVRQKAREGAESAEDARRRVQDMSDDEVQALLKKK